MNRYTIINTAQYYPPTYGNINMPALGQVAQGVGYRPTPEDTILRGPPTSCSAAPYCIKLANQTFVIDRRHRPAGIMGGCGNSYGPHIVHLVSYHERDKWVEPLHPHRVADIVSFFQFHAPEEGPAYVTIDYGRPGVKRLVQAVGIDTDCTTYQALHPVACANTKARLDIACTSRSEGGLYVDIGIWCHSHRSWAQTMQGSYDLACHTGLRQYTQAMATYIYGCHWNAIDDKPWESAHTDGTTSGHGTVTTQHMGVTQGDPNWDPIRQDVQRRAIYHVMNGQIPEGSHIPSLGTLDALPPIPRAHLSHQPVASMIGRRTRYPQGTAIIG